MQEINYKQMIIDVDELLQDDRMFDLQFKENNFTPVESKFMFDTLYKVYQVSHQIHCEACRKSEYII